jgi:hypothetical protein
MLTWGAWTNEYNKPTLEVVPVRSLAAAGAALVSVSVTVAAGGGGVSNTVASTAPAGCHSSPSPPAVHSTTISRTRKGTVAGSIMSSSTEFNGILHLSAQIGRPSYTSSSNHQVVGAVVVDVVVAVVVAAAAVVVVVVEVVVYGFR